MNDTAIMLESNRLPNGDSYEELAAAARNASSWDVAFHPTNEGAFPHRVRARRNELLKLEAELAGLPPAAPDADPRTRALHELRTNPRLLRSGITAATIKPEDLLKLPRVILPHRDDQPRVAGICALYLRTVRGEFSHKTLTAFIRDLQDHDPLTVFELWSLPAFLRFCLLEEILAEAHTALHSAAAPGESPIPVLMGSMRAVANTSWQAVIEPLIAIDSALNQDPAGAYASSDFETRERYRTRVAFIARRSDCTVVQVAEHALDLARQAEHRTYPDPRIHRRLSHVGYYLIDKGFPRLAAQVVTSIPPFPIVFALTSAPILTISTSPGLSSSPFSLSLRRSFPCCPIIRCSAGSFGPSSCC